MKETIFSFGKNNVLAGTLTLPDNVQTASQQPCFVMLNSGLVYQAGPNRLHVELARTLSAQGVTSFRFDLSNVGDSDKHCDDRPYQEQVAADIDVALNLLEQLTNTSRFILFGICTGADNAHKAAIADRRVVGSIFLDGYAFKTFSYHLRHYFIYYPKQFIWKLATPSYFLRRLTELFPSKKNASLEVTPELNATQSKDKEDYYWSVPDKAKTMAELKQLVDRDVRQLHIFSSEWFWCFNHEKQFFRMYQSLDFNNTATCVYLPEVDHIYTLQSDRLKLLDTIGHWVKENFSEH